MKNSGAKTLPPLPVSLQSNMIRFQSSPVEIEKSSEKLWWKLVKFFQSLITSPSVTLPNRVLASTAMMKKINIRRMKTLISEPTDIWMVFNSNYRRFCSPAKRKIRLTRSTRSTRANCGPTVRIWLYDSSLPPPSGVGIENSIAISIRLDTTTKKSNLFQLVLKYAQR